MLQKNTEKKTELKEFVVDSIKFSEPDMLAPEVGADEATAGSGSGTTTSGSAKVKTTIKQRIAQRKQDKLNAKAKAAAPTAEPPKKLGAISYYVPGTMKVGYTYKVSLRISKKQTPFLTIGQPPNVKVRAVRVGKTMSAVLKDQSPEQNSFKIQELNSAVQTIEDDSSFTTWEWSVMPIASGQQKLKMVIVIKEAGLVKDIPVYEDEITVLSSPVYSAKKYLGQYWQWIVSTIAIPFIIWLFGRKKKKKENE